MKVVVIYGKPHDPYTVRAQSLLRMKEVPFTFKELPTYAGEMTRVTGGAREGPQILIGEKAIGGFDTLGSLELKGELDRLLQD